MSHKTGAGRLRESGVKEILRLRATGMTYQKIAENMDVSIGTVFNVARGRTHKDVHEEGSPESDK